jgi:integrase
MFGIPSSSRRWSTRGPRSALAPRMFAGGQNGSFRGGVCRPIHPHMLRHGCGYALANAATTHGRYRPWLGHNIQHTVRYTELAPDRFKNFWR